MHYVRQLCVRRWTVSDIHSDRGSIKEERKLSEEDVINKSELDFYDRSIIVLSHAKAASLPAVLYSLFSPCSLKCASQTHTYDGICNFSL